MIHARGTQIDGTDEVRNVERLVFADSVVPGPPTILGVTPLNGAATLAFDPAPTTVANSFVIQVLTAPGGVQVGALRQVNAGNTTVTVGGLTNGQAVQFRVAGINDLGQGEFSALSAPVTPAPTVATDPIRGLRDTLMTARSPWSGVRRRMTAARRSAGTRSPCTTRPACRPATCATPRERPGASWSPASPTGPGTASEWLP